MPSTLGLSLSLLWLVTFIVGSQSSSRIAIKLVHHDSPHSPLYNPNLTMSERSYIDLEKSNKRASYIAASLAPTTNATTIDQSLVVQTDLASKTVGFLAHLEFGSKQVDQYVFMDTGSAFLWVYCTPSQVKSAPRPIFDQYDSSTYRLEYCNTSNVCNADFNVRTYCLRDVICTFEVHYAMGTYAGGRLGNDDIKFGDDVIESVIFGCATRSNFTDPDFNGVLGLRPSPISLMGQLGATAFGYCIGSLTDTNNKDNKLLIGYGVEVLGEVTQLFTDKYLYVSLEEIRVGGKTVDIDPDILRRREGKGRGMLIDSGATYTYLPRAALEKFEEAIAEPLSSFSTVPRSELKCYSGDIERDLKDFPVVELVFEKLATMVLRPRNLFRQFRYEVFCLAIGASEDVLNNSDVSLLGINMQQNYYISFDPETGMIGFSMVDDCVDL